MVSISICIPVYKRLKDLQRLLDSIFIQTYKNYEVIITDDSPDDSVEKFIKNYNKINCIKYYKNQSALGTPENWNQSIRKANGQWIKLMHDDDWFANENSLQEFYNATLLHKDCDFFFSAYFNMSEKNISQQVNLNWTDNFLLKQSPLNLFKKNYIGNPSCTLIKRSINLFYDNNFKWVVDFEYYIRCLQKVKNYHYINLPLINVGLNEEQVTKYSFRIAEVEIPENLILIKKMGFKILRNIFVYDYYWRFFRNLGIRNSEDIKEYYSVPLHSLLKKMIFSQRKISPLLLKNGFISKILMMVNYLFSLLKKE